MNRDKEDMILDEMHTTKEFKPKTYTKILKKMQNKYCNPHNNHVYYA